VCGGARLSLPTIATGVVTAIQSPQRTARAVASVDVAAAPYMTARATDPGLRKVTESLYLKYYNEPDSVLPGLGLSNDDVDFVTFDHLHFQDVRMLLGPSQTLPGEIAPRRPIFPNAKLLAHEREVATFESPHPMQWAWYVEGGMDGVDPDPLALFDRDIQLGVGVALIWTRGHTDGNHSLCVNTPDGETGITSENRIALDDWQPELSKIPGLSSHARRFGREVIPNANTLEDALDQYDSVVKEKTLADPSRRDPAGCSCSRPPSWPTGSTSGPSARRSPMAGCNTARSSNRPRSRGQ
jgi:hypothetical protein